MRNIRLEIEYDGTGYCGWQVQKNPQPTASAAGGPASAEGRSASGRCGWHSPRKKSIQEVIEKALRKILREKIKLIASGRTDAGVHALAQVANFKAGTHIPCWKLQKALNGNLPKDIAITKAEDAPLDFHSRFHAKSKIYRYVILNRAYPSALLKDKAYLYPYPLDINLMRKEAKDITGEHDFKSFCARASSIKDTVRTIKKITIKKGNVSIFLLPKDKKNRNVPFLVLIDIEADGFLYNMVRNIVGTLIEVGRSKFGKGSMKRILNSENRRFAGPTLPAKGLCLLKVKY